MINTCDVKKIQSTDSAMGKKKVLESTYQLHVNVVITEFLFRLLTATMVVRFVSLVLFEVNFCIR